MRIFKFITIAFILFHSFSLKAQGLNKVYKFNSNTFRSEFDFIFKTSSGYDAFGETLYINGPGSANTDILYAKLDFCGQVQNIFRIGGIEQENLKGVFLNSSGNYDVICERTTAISDQRDMDIIAFELTSNGSVVNTNLIKRDASSLIREQIGDVTPCSSGGYLVSGFDDSLPPYSRYNKPSILKLDQNLNPSWFRSYDVTDGGNLPFVIELPSNHVITSNWDPFGKSKLTKYNSKGKVISTKNINGLNSSIIYVIQQGIYLSESCYFIAHSGNAPRNYMVLKTDTNLNPIWAKQYSDASGNILEFQSIKNIYNFLYISGFQNSTKENMIIKIDTSGKINWSKNFPKKQYLGIQLTGIKHESNGIIGLVGRVLSPSGLPSYHPTFFTCDTSASIYGCEELRTISVSNFSVVSSIENNPSSINNFSSTPITISSNSVSSNIVTSENLCPWEQKDTTICLGDSILISNQYQKIAGVYPDSLISSSGCDCVVIRNLIVSNEQLPQVNLGNDTTLCDGDQITLQNKIPTTLDKQWQDGSNTINFVVNNSGEYWLMEQNDCGEARDTILINYKSIPQVELGNDTTLCDGDQITLQNKIPTTLDKQWQDGSNTINFVVNNSGEYWLMEQNDCGEARDTILINYKSIPQVELGNDTTLCDGDQITLQNKIPSTLDKQWQDGSNTVNYVVNNKGGYWLMEQNDCGETRDTISIDLEPDPSISLGNDTSICEGKQIRLTARTNGTQIVWDNQSNELTRDINQEGIYWVKSTSLKGCVSSDTVKITLRNCDEFELEMPNVFTPNKDLLNNVFIPIKFKGIKTARLQIFNRWGEKLFETHDLEKGWNGLSMEKPVPEGVYFWTLEYIKSNDDESKSMLLSGSVTIIK